LIIGNIAFEKVAGKDENVSAGSCWYEPLVHNGYAV
jgi:hypothetical protein